jgi:hypothetical protein
MQDVPQFVLKRLQENQPASDSHPDADLLTAFAEQSLAGDERARVMEHLTRCGDCRDVVAIALPATEITEIEAETQRERESIALPISVSTAAIGWLRWPTLRWGALAAGILVVTSLGVLEYSHRGEKSVASNRPQDAVAASSGSRQAPSPQATVPQTAMQKAFSATGSQTLMPQMPQEAVVGSGRAYQPPSPARSSSPRSTLPRSGGGFGGGVAGAAGGIGAGSGSRVSPESFAPRRERSVTRAQQNPTAAAGQPVKIGAASEMVEVQAEGPITTESAAISQNQVAQDQGSLPLNGRAFTKLDVVKAKDPVPGQTASSAATVRWTVSSSGVLQRSFDGGDTWENVNPALTVASSGARLAKENTARADVGSFIEAKKNQKAEAAPYPAPVFRAVAAAGLEVWAGGSGGALYHTWDGGNRWSRVTPSVLGVALTGDIIAIQISDSQHGEVSTSTGELWATSDNGQTWQKRQ